MCTCSKVGYDVQHWGQRGRVAGGTSVHVWPRLVQSVVKQHKIRRAGLGWKVEQRVLRVSQTRPTSCRARPADNHVEKEGNDDQIGSYREVLRVTETYSSWCILYCVDVWTRNMYSSTSSTYHHIIAYAGETLGPTSSTCLISSCGLLSVYPTTGYKFGLPWRMWPGGVSYMPGTHLMWVSVACRVVLAWHIAVKSSSAPNVLYRYLFRLVRSKVFGVNVVWRNGTGEVRLVPFTQL